MAVLLFYSMSAYIYYVSCARSTYDMIVTAVAINGRRLYSIPRVSRNKCVWFVCIYDNELDQLL